MSGQDEGEFVAGQGLVVVGESDAAVQLGVAGQAFFDAGHADQDQAEVVPVEPVAQVFQGRGGKTFGFVDDQKFDVIESAPGGRAGLAVNVLVDADVDAAGELRGGANRRR
ncbi:hypothetical protein GCM10022223_32870 [Kineosporia mesophila]|uniref:Uncharacterized protein n=1 Tax=Kineosporia mesophila TaxID=566012 RepID=A0ABP6ZLZ5_9ACTN